MQKLNSFVLVDVNLITAMDLFIKIFPSTFFPFAERLHRFAYILWS